MKELAIILGIVVCLLIGGIIGFAFGVQSVHNDAVASGQAQWVANGSQGNTFMWKKN